MLGQGIEPCSHLVVAERVHLIPELRERHHLKTAIALADVDELLIAGVALIVELGRVPEPSRPSVVVVR